MRRRISFEEQRDAAIKYGIAAPEGAHDRRDFYLARIDEFVRSKPLAHRLRRIGIHRVVDLCEIDEDVLWNTDGMGAKKIGALAWGLASMGMHFGMPSPRHWLFEDEVEHYR